ncbi:hypothetical protein [Aestuariibaculum lutulentum]|uniref:Glycine zipper family protein n=1 Tax=Aestuariibaculum lutulentum TaxID=2920935 RepID=A0ABS9REQ7_9FLAO|nr:hypothetical protein [Aestuariibaculum lutulentum]MCH4551421.1 hypothetical protein [Aestuariibaculum lutulentum]
MKYLILILAFSLVYSLGAQEDELKSKTFLRVYNLNGKKIAKGKLLSTDKFNLKLKRNKNHITIALDSIGSIKTKRSAGHNILIGSSIGAGAAMILIGTSGTSADNYDTLTGIGFLLLTLGGTGIGGITAIGKNSRTFQINGDPIKWEAFRSLIIND